MKILNKKFTLPTSFYPAILLMGVMALGACQDEEGMGMGMPVIERVRNTDPSTADSSFTSASLGSTLAIIGTNLKGTEQVFLNDYPLGINPTYVTNTSVIVTVSDSVPTVATNPDVPNTLRLVTGSGEAIYEFQTLPPAPQVQQVKNQYVRSGEELTLYGRYFYFVDTVYFPGQDAFVTSGFETNSTGTRLTVTVPENLDFSETQMVSVVTRSGASSTNRNTQIYAGKGMIADFDTNGVLEWPWNWGWGISGEMIKPSQPGIESLEGNFGGMNQAFPANYGWNNDKVINLAAWSGGQPFPTSPEAEYDPTSPAANFDIRFELAINTEESIEGLIVQIWYPSANGELSYDIPLTEVIKATDGSWHTFSTNLTRLTNGSSRFETYADFLAGGADGVKQLRILIINSSSSDISAVVGVDNIRVVRAVN